MNDPTRPRPADPRATRGSLLLLDWIAAAVLVLVMLMLGWLIVAAYQPSWLRFVPLESEVLAIVGLLVAALLLVSIVALRHTRN